MTRWCCGAGTRAFLVLLLLCLYSGEAAVSGAFASASVFPASLDAGAVSDVAVTFTAALDVEEGGTVLVDLPTGFEISLSTVLSVQTTGSTTTLSVASVTATQISVQVGTAKISANNAFQFTISDVTNPAEQTTADFTITTYDSSNNILETDTAIQGVTIASTTLASAAVSPDSVNAGVLGPVTVSFVSAVRLPVGSIVTVTFPSDFSVAATAISSTSGIGATSTVAMASSSVVAVTVAGSAVAVGATVSFKLDGVTNPGAKATGTLSVVTTDSALLVFQQAAAISSATITSTLLTSALITVDNAVAGVDSSYTLDFVASVAIPSGGYVFLALPSDYEPSGSIVMEDSLISTTWAGEIVSRKVKFVVASVYEAGQHNVRIKYLQNPGVSTTGSFVISTTDANGFLLETGICSGVDITPGSINDAVLAPQLPHPGIVSRVDISFTASAALAQGSLLAIHLPIADYDIAVLALSVVVSVPSDAVATASWDSVNTAILVLITSPKTIPQDASVKFEVTALEMPPSVRVASTAATIESWNVKGLRLDEPSVLTLSAIAAVQNLPCTWVTETPHPGITSNVLVTFRTNGIIPVGGKIALTIPTSDFYAQSAPSIVFKPPSTTTATSSTWDSATGILEIVIGNQPIPSYTSGIQVQIATLGTPTSVRAASRLPATLTTLDPLGIEIDGPSPLQLDAITAGLILGSRLWTSVKPVAGVTSDQTIAFSTSGKVDPGGQFEFTLPDTQWSMAASCAATFVSPDLGAVGSFVWNEPTRMMVVTLTGAVGIAAYTGVTLTIQDVSNPPKEMGINSAFLTTRDADGGVIDGPGTLSVMTISRGELGGALSWTSTTTTSASTLSDQLISFTLSGALPSGSIVQIVLPSAGWRMADSNSVTASFSLPASGVSVISAVWTAADNELRFVTAGSLSEGTDVELLVRDMINPFSKAVASTCIITTMLADLGVVAASSDAVVNAITSATLPTEGKWLSDIPTPGVLSTQTITFQTGGELEPGASVCITMADVWTFLASTSASLTTPHASSLVLVLNTTTNILCATTSVGIEQESAVTIVITDVRSPESVRPERVLDLRIQSHLGGDVNVGSVRTNAIVKGALTGPLTWQTLVFPPGPVAGLKTSANLAMKTTGKIAAGGYISLVLPSEWVMASACVATFVYPSILGTVLCNQNSIRVVLLDGLSEATTVSISFTGVYNPSEVLPTGTASSQTFAPDGGVIDESNSVTTGAITSAVTGIVNANDHLVAVVGVPKTFTFEGFYLQQNDVVKFVDASTTSDSNCGSSTTGQSDVGGISVKYLSANQDISLKFTQSSPDGQPFLVCYKFGTNPFKLYSAFGITVKEITSMTCDVGLSNVAVADFVKTWSFEGNGIAVEDRIRWIDLDVVESVASFSTPPDCLDTSTLAKLAAPVSGAPLKALEDDYTRVIQSSAHISFAFSAESSGKTFCLCYKFRDEPYVIYPSMKVQINHLRVIEAAATGSNSVAVANAFKTFVLFGDGVFLNDRLYFVEVGSVTSCEESTMDTSLQITHTINDQSQSILFVDGGLTVGVQFDSAAAGMTVIPCYQFGLEPYQLYPELQLIVNMVTQYTGNLGSPLLAVAAVAEPLTFLGFGLNDGDQVRWILRGEEDCESNLAPLTQLDTLTLINTITLDASNAALFNFTTSQVDFNPVLCYKFGEENFKLYSHISIGIGTIRTKSTATGAKDVAVVGARKNFTLSGTNLAASDRIGWTTVLDSCSDLSLLIRNPTNFDDDYQSYLTTTNTFGVALTELSSGKRVYLCYGFGSEPLKVFPDLYMDVKSITNMRALVGSPNVAVAGASKTFLFDGDGVATGDFAKFVSSDEADCSNPGITLATIMKEFDDYAQMAMYLYEAVKGVTTSSFQMSADTYSVGLDRVLCYRFGVEPFFYYENFHIDVKTIWGLHQLDATAGGQDDVMVVNEPKLMAIDGVGMSEKDTLKFVSAGPNTGDADCVGLASQGLVLQQLKVTSNSTLWLPFEFGSKGGTWELCYKFDDEPFRLYSAVGITVKEITALLDYTFQEIADLGSVATIGHVKQWKPVGSGVQEGDSIKIVSHSVTSSAECGQNDANIATGTSIMTVLGADLTFSGVITAFPASTSDVYHLCYRFQDEPFTYVRGFTLTTYGIISLDRSVVLVSASTLAQVSGFRISDTDQMGWTTSSTSCSSIFGVATVSGLQANLFFSTRFTQLALCYSFNSQPFSIFPSITLEVVKAEIWIPQTVSVIADRTMELLVSGTFGITQGSDQIAWIPSDVVACSADTMSAYEGVMQATVASVSKSQTIIPRAGEATFNVKFVAPSSGSGLTVSDSFSTWKLCYRFGSTLDYLMFGDVLCSVLNINQVQLLDLEPSTSGAVMKFEFDGVGVQDFDAAKWVDASLATIDSDCDTLPAVGGSKVRDVVNSRATFTFVEESAAMALCYQFQGHTFKLFANIPIQDSSRSTSSRGQHTTDTIATDYDEEAAAAASDQFTLSREIATVSLTLDKDISEIPAGSAAETAFKASFISTLARSLGIDPSRIQITDLMAGSVIVNFQLLSSESVADPLVGEIIDDLQSQLLDSASALLDSHTIVVKDAATALSLSLTTPPEPAASSMVIQAIGYQQSGLFSFVRSIYSVTERSSSLAVPVIRLQGTSTVVSLIVQVQSKGTTARYNEDYAFSSSATVDNTLQLLYLRFDIGETLQTIELEILDDSVKEAHFESIYLVLQAPQTPGAALGTMKQTSIRIYDYDDGTELVRFSFAPNDQPNPLQGWQVVGNSASLLRIDASGVFAVDDVFGEAEYDQKCDLAAPTGECSYVCELGGGLAPANGLEPAHNVLLLDGEDYAATMNVVNAFPTDAFTVSLWVKTTQTDAAACLYSYAVSSATAPAVPFALCNPANLQLYINSESDVSGLATFVNVSDGLWHFLALTWNSEDGRARIFDNGMLAFDGGPYRGGQSLEGDGVIVVGHLVLSSATQAVCTVGAEALALGGSSSSNPLLPTTSEDLSCDVVANSGFKGQIQHVHVWSRVLARSELLGELAWPLRVVSNGLVLGWNFDSSFLLLQGRVVKDLSMQGQEQQNLGVLHCSSHHDDSDTLAPSTTVGNSSSSIVSSCLLPDALPRLDATFPCGPVYTNIWHFSAPIALTAQLGAAYGGHLQFRLLAPSFNGSPRPRRGQVSIFSTDMTGEMTHISVGLGSFDLPSASRWTYYSVVLREDFGWITEPAGKSLTGAEFKTVLARASALWIRGDIWGYDVSGQGQEVVYLNDIALYTR